MSPEPLSSAIMHWERVNKVFGKRFMRLLDRFFKFVITARLPHRQMCDGRRHQQCTIQCPLHSTIVKEDEESFVLFSQIMFHILNMMICIDMILLDNQLQCLICIVIIDLSNTYVSTAALICNLLVMSMSYSWIKLKLKVLLFPTTR
jgi:hypothetical protein